MDSKLNQMVEEILDRKRREIAEEIAAKLFEVEMAAVSLNSAIPQGKPPIKEQLPLKVIPPAKPAGKGKGIRNARRKRRPYNEMLCVPQKGRGPFPKEGTKLFTTYQTAKALLSSGPAPRIELTDALKGEHSLSYFTASKYVSILMDRELIVPSEQLRTAS